MPELSPETIGLLIGLGFSVAVFAFKTAVGEFYALSGANGRKKLWLLTGSTAVYILLLAHFRHREVMGFSPRRFFLIHSFSHLRFCRTEHFFRRGSVSIC